MTMQDDPGQERSFVSAVLPWLIAIAAMVLYGLTLNHWVSANSLGYVARATGQVWSQEVFQPFFYLVTYPIGWLSPRWVPIAFNLFSAFCAVGALALLARSVALLPHDRTHDQRQREQSAFSLLSLRSAWLPPVLAVAVCGLQLTFWEHATGASSEMFELLLFAYVVRNLLEYRLRPDNGWLYSAALVYGAAMTDNWAMIGFLPVFLAALAWLKGLGFFNVRFVVLCFACGLAGASLYLLLPLLHLICRTGPFWQVLGANLLSQKIALTSVPLNRYILFFSNQPLWIIGLTSLLPIAVIGIRWASSFGDPSRLGVALTTWIFHLTHAALLAACIWVAFDPVFSPRNHQVPVDFTVQRQLYYLPFYYLGALSVGYFSGYFLLVFSPMSRSGRQPSFEAFLDRVFTGVIAGLAVLVPVALIFENIPQIHVTNGPALRQYATQLTENLPPNAVVLSDDPFHLFLAETAAAQMGGNGDRVYIDTRSLVLPAYSRFQVKRYGTNTWPSLGDRTRNDIVYSHVSMLDTIVKFARQRPVYYLHPSFGFFFESLYPEPHGLVLELKEYPTNSISAPPLPDSVLDENEKFWARVSDETLRAVAQAATLPEVKPEPSLRKKFTDKLHIPPQANFNAAIIGSFYSRHLNYWGVIAQKSGRLEEAARAFDLAHQLNPNNVVAEVNLKFNKNLQAGERVPLQISSSMEDRFGAYHDWTDVVGKNGPFDEPSFCFEQGRVYARGNNFRQAAQQFERVTALAPDNLSAEVWLTRLELLLNFPARALDLLDDIETRSAGSTNAEITPDEITRLKVVGNFSARRTDAAEGLIRSAVEKNPPDPTLLANLVQVCMMFGHFSNAIPVVDKFLESDPDNINELVNKGFLLLQVNDYEHAIPPLTRALEQAPTNNAALLNRAIANLRKDRLDDAQRDYEALQQLDPKSFQACFGLGEIAFQKKDTNRAIEYYQRYLANSPRNPDEIKLVNERLKSLKPGSP